MRKGPKALGYSKEKNGLFRLAAGTGVFSFKTRNFLLKSPEKTHLFSGDCYGLNFLGPRLPKTGSRHPFGMEKR